jgi:hypothetical protein
MLHSRQTVKHTEKDGRIMVDKEGNPAAVFDCYCSIGYLDFSSSVAGVRIGAAVQPMANHA